MTGWQAVHRGEVTRVAGSKVFVRLPRHVPGAEFGPLEQLLPIDVTSPTGSAGDPAHTHTITVRRLQAGDRVLVAAVDSQDDFVVLGRLP